MAFFIPVDGDFDHLFCYSYAANDNRSALGMTIQGCRELWATVLEEAFRSADLSNYVQSRDFSLVCEFAGV